MPTIALIVAAGTGERARTAESAPKQYRKLAGKPVLRWAVEAFSRHPKVDAVKVVIRDGDQADYEDCIAGLPLLPPALGGATRQHSVHNGLESLTPEPPERVLIHDAARPFVSHHVIAEVADALGRADAAAPLIAVSDTLRRSTDGVSELVARDGLFRAQTPQGFRFAKILDAHRRFAAEPATDDLALAERAGLSFAAVKGDESNMKLTEPEDFALAEKLASSAFGDVRTGTGFDAHRFAAGDHVWLCGVKVPHDRGLEGHSDADVGLHALTDAILGAISAEDIGAHFPPSDERWRGAPSRLFLEHAARLVRDSGGVIAHVDVTLICERPKIAPHRQAMREKLAEILSLDLSRISVKATTTDGLGFAGRREGMAAQAVATIRLHA
jgi:2-C-methyl-D-erythritol 4-phosphate cytidylyltransferase/2-C-methyl-D-erythritol 2,4-cyclodiphosphate synthase